MTELEAIAALDAITTGDPEGAHSDADTICRSQLSPAVREALERCRERTGPWWYA